MLGRKDNEEADKALSEFISNESIELLNFRINKEEYASRLYHSMAIWLKANGYEGFAKFWSLWSKEELTHANWAVKYLLDLNVAPETKVIDPVKNNFESLKEVIYLTLTAEKEITKECNDLAVHCAEEKDFMLMVLAQKYTNEQREEINKITNIISQAKIYGCSTAMIMELDEKLGETD